LIVYK